MPLIVQPFYPQYRESGQPYQNIEELFAALILRRSSDPQDEYLRLQGAAPSDRPCQQANHILGLNWGGRAVLTAGEGLPNRCASGLTIAQNGERFPPLEPARLKAGALFPYSGFTRTLLENDNGMAWERNVVWCPGHFFVILDYCTALTDAEFSVEARWVAPEDAALTDRILHIHTGSPRFALISAGESKAMLDNATVFPMGEHTESGSLKILRQTMSRPMKAGDVLAFINLICPVQDNAPPFERIDDTVALIGGKHSCLLGRADEGWSGGELRIKAMLFTLSEDGFSGIGLSEVMLANRNLFASSHPVNIEADTRHGNMTVECLQTTECIIPAQEVRWGDHHFGADRSGLIRIQFPRGRHELTLSETAGIPFPAFQLQEPGLNKERLPVSEKGAALCASFWQARLGGRVRDADAYGSLLAVGSERGDVLLLDPWGQSKARIHIGSPVTRLAIAPGAASGMTGVLVGTEDAALALYALDGERMWRKGFGRGYCQRPRLACSLACIGGSSPRFLAGLADGSLIAFSSEGMELWQARLSHYPITCLAAVGGEGARSKIVAGSESCGLCLLDEEGRLLWQTMRGPAFPAAVLDPVGGGRKEIVSGGAFGLQVYRQDSGQIIREINLGGAIAGLAAHPADPILYTVSDIGVLAAIGGDGVLWRIGAGEPASCMAYAEGPNPLLALGMLSGHIQFRSPADGQPVAVLPASEPFHSLHPGPNILWSVGRGGRIEGIGPSESLQREG